jgi:O-antigen ligase
LNAGKGHTADAHGPLPGGLRAYLLLLPALLLFSRVLADATVLLTGLAFIWHSARSRSWAWVATPWFRLSLLLVAYLVFIAAPRGFQPLQSVLYSLAYLRWPLFAAALGYWLLAGARAQQQFSVALLVVILFIVFDTGWQWRFGADLFGIPPYDVDRLTGPLRNPVPASFTLRLLPIALLSLLGGLLVRGQPVRVNGALVVLMLFPAFCLITGERMSVLLCVPAVALLLLGIAVQGPRYTPRIVAVTVALLLLVATLLAVNEGVYARVVEGTIASLQNFSSDNYGAVFRAGWRVWQLNAWTGVGLSSYAEYCDAVAGAEGFAMCGRHPHNIYLHWLAEASLPGLLLFLASIIALVRFPLRSALLQRMWLLLALQLALLFVNFWPLAAAPAIINNWFASIVWCGLGWILATPSLVAGDAAQGQGSGKGAAWE